MNTRWMPVAIALGVGAFGACSDDQKTVRPPPVADVGNNGLSDGGVDAPSSDGGDVATADGGDDIAGETGCLGDACGPDVTGIDEASARLLGVADGDRAGRYVASVGDVNGDGNPDVAIGAPHNDDGDELRSNNAGAAYVWFGPVSGTVSASDADARLLGESSVNYASIVAPAGDVNNDGVDDLLVGAYGAFSPQDAENTERLFTQGAAYLIHGPLARTVDLEGADARIYGEREEDSLGTFVRGVGDLDSDGFDDVAVGAAQSSGSTGILYLFYGPVTGRLSAGDADARFVGPAGSRTSKAWGLGDVNGDGRDDLIVSAVWASGGAWLFYGRRFSGEIDLEDADATFVAGDPINGFGTRVAGPFDLDRDGEDEIVIGASGGPFWSFAPPFVGVIALEDGRGRLVYSRDWAGSMAFGDFDGDGNIDLAGSRAGVVIDGVNDCYNDASVEVLFGPILGNDNDRVPDLVIEGESSCDGTGIVLDALPSFYTAGVHSIVAGAPGLTAGGRTAGGAYVFGRLAR